MITSKIIDSPLTFPPTTTVLQQNKTTPKFTICVLLYGDHLNLAKRCLDSIIQLPPELIELRIGMNAICNETRKYVYDVITNRKFDVLLFDSPLNQGKYPLMRWMFHDIPIRSPYIQWFDDDSYIKTPTEAWLKDLEAIMRHTHSCGAVMQIYLTESQRQWIEMQNWYCGEPIQTQINRRPFVPCFLAGGWWTIHTEVIQKLNWPPANIIHRGGDVMLGEAMRQRNFQTVHYLGGIAINADEAGTDHKSIRRGINPLPVGLEYIPPLTAHIHDSMKGYLGE